MVGPAAGVPSAMWADGSLRGHPPPGRFRRKACGALWGWSSRWGQRFPMEGVGRGRPGVSSAMEKRGARGRVSPLRWGRMALRGDTLPRAPRSSRRCSAPCVTRVRDGDEVGPGNGRPLRDVGGWLAPGTPAAGPLPQGSLQRLASRAFRWGQRILLPLRWGQRFPMEGVGRGRPGGSGWWGSEGRGGGYPLRCGRMALRGDTLPRAPRLATGRLVPRFSRIPAGGTVMPGSREALAGSGVACFHVEATGPLDEPRQGCARIGPPAGRRGDRRLL